MATSRINISTKFENGDIPSQSDFGEVFNSFVHKDDDKADFQMVEAGIDNERYVTPALLRIGLQNLGVITGNCYLPFKEYFNNFNGSTIFLKKLPINFSVQAFKNGQLLLEKEDYTINYSTAVITFSATIPIRNIEIDYWYKNTASIPGNTDVTANVAGNPYIGEIKCLASPTGPKGWLKCEGQELLISEYSQLFSAIGVTYGGNGTTHFKIPNLSGRSIVQSTTTIPLGSTGGNESIILSEDNLPSHTHDVGSLQVAINCTTLNADETSPRGSILALSQNSYCRDTVPTTTLGASAASISGVTSSVGSAQPISTRSPYLAMYYYISSYGESLLT